MKSTLFKAIILAGSIIALAPTSAQAETGRYTMTPTKNGVLKLDTKTGIVSLCQHAQEKWTCKSVDDDDSGLRKTIKRLEQENAELRAKLEMKKLAPIPNDSDKLDIPSEEDVDKAMDFMEKLLHRFKGMVEGMRKDEKDENGVPL